MKIKYYILFVFVSLLIACSNDENEREYTMMEPPIGESFESLSTSITFESTDSVRFHFIENPEELEGKAKYTFNNGKIQIENPYGKFLRYEDVTKAYFYFFDGAFTSKDKLEANYELVATHGHILAMGTNIWWRVKQHSPKR